MQIAKIALRRARHRAAKSVDRQRWFAFGEKMAENQGMLEIPLTWLVSASPSVLTLVSRTKCFCFPHHLAIATAIGIRLPITLRRLCTGLFKLEEFLKM